MAINALKYISQKDLAWMPSYSKCHKYTNSSFTLPVNNFMLIKL